MSDCNIPWKQMMGMAFTRWSLSPKAFWSMTLKEFDAAANASSGQHSSDVPDRGFLETALTAYPDNKGSKNYEQ